MKPLVFWLKDALGVQPRAKHSRNPIGAASDTWKAQSLYRVILPNTSCEPSYFGK
jgi:hypothetical protein